MIRQRQRFHLALVTVLLALACSRRGQSHGDANADTERLRSDLAASQQRMQATEARIQSLTQQSAMQQAENRALRERLQTMGSKMRQARGQMARMQAQGRVARTAMEGLSRNASDLSQEAPEPAQHPQFGEQLAGIRRDAEDVARGLARSAVANPGAFF
jgi:chromosome segregation ATPase